ncbi:BrnT family toxin [Methylobacterium sp. E-041]|uniref:BrnT family toxin n=1 Tax=Methylobacterium sp. E-041 TaxID=2836573 RepID=UPI001FBACC10|nr:BrnT family toxin [Methylobacterium sp. E-041]MCJ2107033.1 BrnT family toxin [Methylobacterium sp. E-041]
MRFFATEPKRTANVAKHGFDPADFVEAFSFDRYLSCETTPSRTGRKRNLLIGTWRGEAVVVVIISPLGNEACDVVSVRHASEKERAAYDRS